MIIIIIIIKKSSVKLIQLKESYDLYDICRIRNSVTRTFTCRQKHCAGFIQRRLDNIFISNSLQEFLNDTSILTSLSSRSSLSVFKENKHTKSDGFLESNSS